MIQLFFYRTLSALMPILGFFLSLWNIYNIDTRFVPVLKEFSVDYIEHKDGAYVIGGTMRTQRNCELIRVSVIGVRLPQQAGVVLSQINSDGLGASTAVGFHTWGPRSISIPQSQVACNLRTFDHLELRAVHRCNPLWLQETHYADIPMERIPL